jgi:hypothetical protein
MNKFLSLFFSCLSFLLVLVPFGFSLWFIVQGANDNALWSLLAAIPVAPVVNWLLGLSVRFEFRHFVFPRHASEE